MEPSDIGLYKLKLIAKVSWIYTGVQLSNEQEYIPQFYQIICHSKHSAACEPLQPDIRSQNSQDFNGH
ncbi:hypothetical protein FGO68_gene8553 [Halteria grandinella]|uniref:Uncharacterized protein n=1 Tax=Halteria grandinella TaxID=5974 RepID=A0A8J8T8H6_HALGN|nr:hypothetical protein FGO68_gene8553 [Halteria grandinella]